MKFNKILLEVLSYNFNLKLSINNVVKQVFLEYGELNDYTPYIYEIEKLIDYELGPHIDLDAGLEHDKWFNKAQYQLRKGVMDKLEKKDFEI